MVANMFSIAMLGVAGAAVGLAAWILWVVALEKAPDDLDRRHKPIHSRDVVAAVVATLIALCLAAAFISAVIGG